MLEVFYLVAVALLPGEVKAEYLSGPLQLAECFERREYLMHQSGISDPNQRMRLGIQLVCVGKIEESI